MPIIQVNIIHADNLTYGFHEPCDTALELQEISLTCFSGLTFLVTFACYYFKNTVSWKLHAPGLVIQ